MNFEIEMIEHNKYNHSIYINPNPRRESMRSDVKRLDLEDERRTRSIHGASSYDGAGDTGGHPGLKRSPGEGGVDDRLWSWGVWGGCFAAGRRFGSKGGVLRDLVEGVEGRVIGCDRLQRRIKAGRCGFSSSSFDCCSDAMNFYPDKSSSMSCLLQTPCYYRTGTSQPEALAHFSDSPCPRRTPILQNTCQHLLQSPSKPFVLHRLDLSYGAC